MFLIRLTLQDGWSDGQQDWQTDVLIFYVDVQKTLAESYVNGTVLVSSLFFSCLLLL